MRRQVCRRVIRRTAELGLPGFDAYRRYLEETPAEWPVLDSFCRVTISRFYRDRNVFHLLGHELLPELAARATDRNPGGSSPRDGAVLRSWSAGCASGEEPYTLAMVWQFQVQPRLPDIRLHVLATDSDPALLQRAATARYPASSLRELSPEWVGTAFSLVDGEYLLRQPFRHAVQFRHHDIRSGMPAGPFHLVLCRNLAFTYFQQALQARLLAGITQLLVPGGFLVIGAHEKLPAGDWPLEQLGAVPVFCRI